MEEKKPIWNLRVFASLMKSSFIGLQRNDPLRMAGATAFFTTFALPPIIVLLFQLFALFFDRKMVGTELGEILSSTLGDAGATQLRQTSRGFRNLAQNWYMAVLGLLFLVFVATTLFKVIKNTLNDLWNVRLERGGFVYDLKIRARSLVVILAAGILFLAGSVLDAVRAFAGKYIAEVWKAGGLIFTSALSEIFGIVVVTVWFMVLFRFLANARPSWRMAFAGGLLTGILFTIGKAILGVAMRNSNANVVYGAGGAIVLILLFVFYSSFILYFGASFIREYSVYSNDPIVPSRRAYLYELQKVQEHEG